MKAPLGITVLIVIGMMLSGYAFSLHFENGGSICDINETVSCDKVNKSQWATLFGIPVAALGFVAYLFLFLVLMKQSEVRNMLAFTKKDLWQYILIAVTVMTAFQIYLTYREVVDIKAYCLICVTNQILILILLYLVFKEWRNA